MELFLDKDSRPSVDFASDRMEASVNEYLDLFTQLMEVPIAQLLALLSLAIIGLAAFAIYAVLTIARNREKR